MAQEHEARMRVVYDHESEETGRRRHAVADWGVGEDIFDRMPSRRFTRAERRAAHSGTIVISRDEAAQPIVVHAGDEPDVSVAEPQRRFARAERVADEPRRERAVESWAAEEPRRERAVESWVVDEPRRDRALEAWMGDAPRRERVPDEPRERTVELWVADEAREVESDEQRRERVIESWLETEPAPRRAEPEPLGPVKPPTRLVAASARPEPAPLRTVVVPSAAEDAHPRRTVVISGHPGGLPAARPERPPRTAIERVGTRPDRIVAYAVALGFLLVLIAVLTTGQ
ncbi:MAG TPA: hypothetical protein VFZ00_21830 [Solirubrobacter sp.]|nr:hypothetical protein [Solirubrobacter sp.]